MSRRENRFIGCVRCLVLNKVCSEDFSPQKRRTEVLTTNRNQEVCSEDFSP